MCLQAGNEEDVRLFGPAAAAPRRSELPGLRRKLRAALTEAQGWHANVSCKLSELPSFNNCWNLNYMHFTYSNRRHSSTTTESKTAQS